MELKLQLALDFLDFDSALSIAKKASPFVDIIEAGTPLIKYNGIGVVKKLKEEFPDKIINADMKTADVGDLETKIAADAGANIVTILGAAPIETIRSAVLMAKNYNNLKIAVDTIGVNDVFAKAKEIENTEIDYFLIHCGIDEQKAGKDPLENVRLSSEATKMPLIACGGIKENTAAKFKEIETVEIVIVGGAITKADDPKEAARKIKMAIS